jgi:hypothetical protein
MIHHVADGTGVNVLDTIKSQLRHRPVWSARELRNAVVRIVDANGIVHRQIGKEIGYDATVVSRALGGYGALRGNVQFDHIAIALGFTPCGDVEYRTYKPALIDRVAA